MIRGEEYLRGCIGNFKAMDVHQGLKRYALIRFLFFLIYYYFNYFIEYIFIELFNYYQ